MHPDEYIQNVLKTESVDFEAIAQRAGSKSTIRLMHASLGMQTESAEFADAMKKHLFYGKPLDVTNLQEELGDLLWYVAVACDDLGVSFETLMAQNIRKLKARYGDKFTQKAAMERNLDVERRVLTDSD